MTLFSLRRHVLSAIALLPLLVQAVIAAEPVVQHQLMVQLNPAKGSLSVTDTMRVPAALAPQGRVHFTLGAQLQLDSSEPPVTRIEGEAEPGSLLYEGRLGPDGSLVLSYSGAYPLPEQGADLDNGVIADKGVFLSAASHWFPQVTAALVSFEMTVALPGGWEAVSQGERRQHTRKKQHTLVVWREQQPQDDIYLVAGRFSEYTDKADRTAAMVFLREPDQALAQTYLEATVRYLRLYQELLGPYPYAKFALVENFWDTGYGMPSFTLLGARVIRLPFIVYSSYPHEILHNWWGNGVYVDYASGNWAEGLTAYLADHLFKEQQGQGAAYRRDNLQKYTDFVSEGRDFPLTDFVSRHSSSTEAVGYGKTMMMFHMLRLELGDELFIKALRAFYNRYRFVRAGFTDLQQVFNDVTKQDRGGFFRQWVQRTGAPELRVDTVQVKQLDGAYRVSGVLRQNQPQPYQLSVPVALQLQGQETLQMTMVSLSDAATEFSIDAGARPLRLLADPYFDVFRRLDSREIPAALSQGLGGESILVVLPAAEEATLREAWRAMFSQWQEAMGLPLEFASDSELQTLPADRMVWLPGWKNRFRDTFAGAAREDGVTLGAEQGVIAGQSVQKDLHGILAAARNPANGASTLLWLAAPDVATIQNMARKLPHYRKYSYLVFQGQEAQVISKGQWSATGSPLIVNLASEAELAAAPISLADPRSPLVVPAAAGTGHGH